MCIAILKTKNGFITDEELRNSFENNSDGAGIAYTHNNELRIVKGIFDVEAFIKTVRQAEKLADNNMLIHCRIGTSGNKDKNNTHPFKINENICLIHNGILSVSVPKGSKINDTQIFINKFMKGIANATIMNNPTYHNILEEMIGSNNKFVILNNKGEFKIINEKAGSWENGVWFSNGSHKTKKVTYKNNFWDGYYRGYKGYYSSYFDDDYETEVYDDDLTDEQIEDVINLIQNLDYEKALYLGYNVCYDATNRTLVNWDDADIQHSIYPLDECSNELYELYCDYIEEILYKEEQETGVA